MAGIRPLAGLYHNIQLRLKQSEVDTMKSLLLTEQVTENEQGNLHSAMDVFLHLERKGFIGKDNINLLLELLGKIGREPLREHVRREFQKIPKQRSNNNQPDATRLPVDGKDQPRTGENMPPQETRDDSNADVRSPECDVAGAVGGLHPQMDGNCESMQLAKTNMAKAAKDGHTVFMKSRSQGILGREEEVGQISKYVESSTSDVPLVVVGEPGTGKSAMVARIANRYLQQNKKYKVFYHFVGATPGSTNLHGLLSRVWFELMHHSDPVPVNLDELIRSMTNVYSKANDWALGAEKTVLLLIDALNQLESDGEAHKLEWLPRRLPPRMRVIVSTLEGPYLETLRSFREKPQEVELGPLESKFRKDIISARLSGKKTLKDKHMRLLIKKEDAGNPLWLSIVCDEICLYREFYKSTDQIKSIPNNLSSLLRQVLERTVHENGDLVKATLCLLECSKHGLSQEELLKLLAMKPLIPAEGEDVYKSTGVGPDIQIAQWRKVYDSLEKFLRPCGENSSEGRLDFFHRSISKAVRSMYLKDEDGVKNWWHHKLADYFQTSADTNRRAEELPYHLVNIDDMRRLEECLLEWPVFLTLYKAGKTVELMGYWRIIGSYELAAKLYVEKLEMSNDTLNVGPEGSKTREAENMYKRKLVSGFLAEIGQYDAARENLCKFVEFHVKEYGNDDIESLVTLLRLCYDEVKKFSYEAHPDCRKCEQFGKEYAERCLQALERKGIDEEDPSLGQFYLYCLYFLRDGGYLDKAERIFKRNGDNKGMAQLQCLRGQTMQRHELIEAAIVVYEKALKLCQSEFGEFHKVTARCYQSYGQLYWNRWALKMDEGWETYLTDSVKLYKKELQILETLLGPLHPNTVRSRQDVIIVFQRMGNRAEAEKLKRQQPQGSERIAEFELEN